MRWRTVMMAHGVLCCAVLACGAAAGADEKAPEPEEGFRLAYSEDFDRGLEHWDMTDPGAWAIVHDKGKPALALKRNSKYRPPVRSPYSIARPKGVEVEDFVLEVRMKSTTREYGHRDLCVFFGYQDPSHFYYVHLASAADPHAYSVFLVNGADRVSIAKERTEGVRWTDDYHTVRITRDTDSGRIEVFFDDMQKPVITAEDKTLLKGGIGLGSFDDTRIFANLRVWIKSPADAANK